MVDHVYTLFDGDTAGQAGVQRLKDRFGGKVRNIVIPEENGASPDITDWVVKYGRGVDDLETLVNDVRGGGLLLSVWDAVKEHTEVQSAKGIQFGIEKLEMAKLDTEIAMILTRIHRAWNSSINTTMSTSAPVQRNVLA